MFKSVPNLRTAPLA